MKTPFHSALVLSLTLVSAISADTAFTAAVGYSSGGLHPGMNLVGLRLHQSPVARGEILSLGKDFAELGALPRNGDHPLELSLTQGTTYILEITSGQKAGVIQEINHWQGLRLTLSDDISTAGVQVGDHFTLREAATLNSVFDPRTCGLSQGPDAHTADNVLIPQGATLGDFRRCFIFSTPEGSAWVDADTGQPVGDLPLVYPDGLIVQWKGPGVVQIPQTGEVKTGPTRSVVKHGLNLVATPHPAAAFLQDLGLANDLQKSDDPTKADKVWIEDGTFGRFTTYFLTADNQWISSENGQPVTDKIPVGSAILIERRAGDAMFCLGD